MNVLPAVHRPSVGMRLWLTLLLLPAAASGADLLDSYRDAIDYDAQFAAARAALEAGREKLPQARAGLLPVINLSANTTKNEVDYETRPSVSVLPLRYNSNGWGVNLTQPLFRWQNWESYKQSELMLAQVEAQYAAARQDLLLRVSQAYFDVLLAQETVAAAQAQKGAIAEQLAAVQHGFEIGTASLTDTQEAQARFDLARAQVLAADNDLLIKRRALRTISGKETPQLKSLRPGPAIGRPQPDDGEQWANSSEHGNLSVMAARANYEIAQREVSRQRAGHLPTLDLVAARGRTSQQTTMVAGILYPGNDTSTTTLALQLSMPLLAGGSLTSRDREAAAQRDKAHADLDNAQRQAALQALQAYLGVTSGLAQVQALEQGLASSESALVSNRMGFQIGMRSNIDVLNSQQQVYSTRRDLAKARVDTLLSHERLKAAAGTLGDEDLVAINALLE